MTLSVAFELDANGKTPRGIISYDVEEYSKVLTLDSEESPPVCSALLPSEVVDANIRQQSRNAARMPLFFQEIENTCPGRIP